MYQTSKFRQIIVNTKNKKEISFFKTSNKKKLKYIWAYFKASAYTPTDVKDNALK